MAKYAPDEMLDAPLDYVAGGNVMTVCSGSPTTYTAAYTTNKLAEQAMTSGSFTKADDTSGRKLTVSAADSVPIAVSGDALAVCIVNTGDSTLRYVTVCVQQTLVAGGTVDVPEWKISIADPS